ncbi:MAG: hypothetical protein EBU66_16555, partial [Bacteroidetes bacterium]|nr:hypothetical protein [Bacteroidota bacterium]
MKQNKSALFLFGVLLTVIILSVIFGAKTYEHLDNQSKIYRGSIFSTQNIILYPNDKIISEDGNYIFKLETNGDISIKDKDGKLI